MKFPIILPAALILSSLSIFSQADSCTSFPAVSETTLTPYFSRQQESLYISDIALHPDEPLLAIAVNTQLGNNFVQLVDISDPANPGMLGKTPSELLSNGYTAGEPISSIRWSDTNTLAVTVKGNLTPLNAYSLFNNSELTERREWWRPDNLGVPTMIAFHPGSDNLFGPVDNKLLQFDTNNTYYAFFFPERRVVPRFNLTGSYPADAGKTFTSLAFSESGDALFVGQNDGVVHFYDSSDPDNLRYLSTADPVAYFSNPINAIVTEEVSSRRQKTYHLSPGNPGVFSTTLYHDHVCITKNSVRFPSGSYGKLERDPETGVLGAIGDDHIFFDIKDPVSSEEDLTLRVLYRTPNPSFVRSDFSHPPRYDHELFGMKFIGDGLVASGGVSTLKINRLITDGDCTAKRGHSGAEGVHLRTTPVVFYTFFALLYYAYSQL